MRTNFMKTFRDNVAREMEKNTELQKTLNELRGSSARSTAAAGEAAGESADKSSTQQSEDKQKAEKPGAEADSGSSVSPLPLHERLIIDVSSAFQTLKSKLSAGAPAGGPSAASGAEGAGDATSNAVVVSAAFDVRVPNIVFTRRLLMPRR